MRTPYIPLPESPPPNTGGDLLIWGFSLLGALFTIAGIAGCFLLMKSHRHGIPLPFSLPRREKAPVPPPTPEWKVPEYLELEDLDWLREQADLAEFKLPAARKVQSHKKLELSGGTPEPFPTPSGLTEINGTWYQKYNTTNGSYLKEVAAPPSKEQDNEESVTVRDFAGGVVVEHRVPGNRDRLPGLPDLRK